MHKLCNNQPHQNFTSNLLQPQTWGNKKVLNNVMDKDNRHGGDIGSHVRQRVTNAVSLYKKEC